MNTDKIKRHKKVKSNRIGLTDEVVVRMSRSEHLRAVPGLGQSGRASEKADQSLPPLGR